jgi:hypothetical protein
MAEIPIERKPRRSISPLLLVLMLIAIVAGGWYLWTVYGDSGQTGPATSSVSPSIRSATMSVFTSNVSTIRRV